MSKPTEITARVPSLIMPSGYRLWKDGEYCYFTHGDRRGPLCTNPRTAVAFAYDDQAERKGEQVK